ncbi:serine protease, partial [Vibrio anguillarum]|nr:serine protease [Vibrio anguillarum]
MVALHHGEYKDSFCGGSYLGGKYVLTAAHCVTKEKAYLAPNAEDIQVTVGTNDLYSTAGYRVKVKQIYYHEDYNATLNRNDIAILELERTLPIEAITRPTVSLFDALVEGSAMQIIGFGTTKYDLDTLQSSNPSSVLRKAEVSLMDTERCKNLGPASYANIENDVFCTTSFPQDTCQGDSGGPIFVKSGTDFIQYGVVSWGLGCGFKSTTGVYAKVDHFNDWLTKRTSNVSFRQTQLKDEIKYGTHTHRF